MDFSNIDMDILIPELDARRSELNLSFQNIADACNVSQATIIRVFKRKTEPTVDILQKIMYAVSYEPQKEEIVLSGYTQDDYIKFLRQSLIAKDEAHAIEIGKLRADYNMNIAAERRVRLLHDILLFVVVGFLLFFLTYDFLCRDRGWIQWVANRYDSNTYAPFDAFLQAIGNWLGAL